MAGIGGSLADTNPSEEPFAGAVLTGGQSRRMGRDKARLEVDGTALAVRTAAALRSAGADEVFCVGGATSALRDLGLVAIDDAVADQGPLGGILTAFDATSADLVVILACDMPLIGASEIDRIVQGLRSETTEAVAAPRLLDRWQFLTAAWRRSEAESVLRRAFADGQRSVRRVVEGSLGVVEIALDQPGRVEDADTPDDLRRLLGRAD